MLLERHLLNYYKIFMLKTKTFRRTTLAVGIVLLLSAAKGTAPQNYPMNAKAVEQEIRKKSSELKYSYHRTVWYQLQYLYDRIERYKVEQVLARSEEYFPMIEEVFTLYELPLELKYMAVIESWLNPLAKSPAGAVGLWQFMPTTARNYGLEVSNCIDERRDPYKSTIAAAKYLKDMERNLGGNWLLAIASYNCGEGRMQEAIEKLEQNGKKIRRRSFWDIREQLPTETQGYVPAFIATAFLMEHYQQWGFWGKWIDDEPLHAYTLSIEEPALLTEIAMDAGVDYDDLKKLNPTLVSNRLECVSLPLDIKMPMKNPNLEIDALPELQIDEVLSHIDYDYLDASPLHPSVVQAVEEHFTTFLDLPLIEIESEEAVVE